MIRGDALHLEGNRGKLQTIIDAPCREDAMNDSPEPTFKYVFGPVPSRRLGRSLGVDLIPRKVCTLDCVYCQVGRTTTKTVERVAYVPPDEVLAEIEAKLKSPPLPDVITLAGSGEPTLNAQLGEIIAGIKRMSDVPVVVLTNGTLFWDPAVRAACAQADLVLPSLDAGDEPTFQAINRPAPGLSLERVVQGLEAFRAEFSGEIHLEVFLIEGVNADEAQIEKIRALTERIRPDRIQLNTAVRPTADEGVNALTEERLNALCALLGPKAEVIADFRKVHEQPAFAVKADEVLAMIRRRPVTLDDTAAGLGVHVNEASKYVEELLSKGLIREERRGDKRYFRAD